MAGENIYTVKLDKDLKPAAKDFGLKLFRNKNKQMHVKAIASYLIEKGLVEVTCISFEKASFQEIAQLKQRKQLFIYL